MYIVENFVEFYDFFKEISVYYRQNNYQRSANMLEIVFTSGRIGAGAVKIVGVTEGTRINSQFLGDEDNALLRKYAKQMKFVGAHGKTIEVCGKQGKIMAVGLGKKPTTIGLCKIGAILAHKLFTDAVAAYYAEPIKAGGFSDEQVAHYVALGLMIGSYRFDKYFTTKKAEDYPNLEQVIFKVKNPAQVNENFKNFAALANGVRYARDLCNEPANYLTPEVFAADIKRLEYLGLDIDILGGEELKEKGFGLLTAVAQGSVQEPKVAVIKWKGNQQSDSWDLALVGKGVTFDSGGISLKPAKGMEDMKQDMTGAAVVTASLKILALQCAQKNVIGIVGLVENMPSGGATKPGDIATSLSGQTVEIINTDAEGRLVLADIMTYVQQQYNVPEIIDIATLTGATMRALGDQYAGIFANNDKLADNLIGAGKVSGEELWRMPINENYNRQLDSDFADMQNIGGANAGGSTAACFLQRFVQKGVHWAHLDIAGVDKENKGTPLCPKGATAWGVRLLNAYINK